MLAAAQSASATTATNTYTTPGPYSFTVPPGVSSLTIAAIGGAGNLDGCTNANAGGQGAGLTATVPVSPGESLQIMVAGNGHIGNCGGGDIPGGIGGGGDSLNGGGGGGGASAVGSSLAPFGSLLVVAGGGGGAGFGFAAGAGGNAGSAGGNSSDGQGGGAGTLFAGGAGGAPGSSGSTGGAGSFGQGGYGAATISGDGGGGGGGYYGGGGGGSGTTFGGGGGGGSSFIVNSATNVTAPAPTASPAEVALTYAAPTAALSAAALTFPGTQPQGLASAEQTLTVTNNGSAPLVVSGATVSGTNASDYLVSDRCASAVPAGSSCTIGVRFAPAAQGASTAALTLQTNAPVAPGAVTLSGTGGKLPQGPAGKIELVVCKTVTKHHKSVKKCTAKLVSGPVKFTIGGVFATATVARAGRVYATGLAVRTGAHGPWRLMLTDRRPLRAGRYTLILRVRRGHRWVHVRSALTIG